MNLLVALTIFILFWWALLATIFSFQMHKENEEYARRLGERLPNQKARKPDYFGQLAETIVLSEVAKSIKLNLSGLSFGKILRLLPLKIMSK